MAKKKTSKRRSSKAKSSKTKARKRTKPVRRARPAARKPVKSARRPVRRAKPAVRRPAKVSRPRPRQPAATAAPKGKPSLERQRRQLPDAERLTAAREARDDRMLAAARSGHDELRAQLQKHTETSPALTAGDIDAKWEDAYAVGDEAPGGDNPTPDQDRVDDIGKALGVQYQDDQELMGGDEIAERDSKRWELDPASSDDWPHKE